MRYKQIIPVIVDETKKPRILAPEVQSSATVVTHSTEDHSLPACDPRHKNIATIDVASTETPFGVNEPNFRAGHHHGINEGYCP